MIPTSTYRVQLTEDAPLADVRDAAAYFDRLGVGAVYVSPVLRARRGSTHGYDVVDPSRVDERLGGEAGLVAAARALHRRRVGLVVDLVPNHMATGPENPWWLDVLEHGPASRFAAWFDIDWHASGLPGKVLVPILGEPYGRVLESGGLRLVADGRGIAVMYGDHRLPVDPADHARILGTSWRGGGEAGERLRAALARGSERIPSRDRADAASVTRRARESARQRRALAEALQGSPAVRRHVAERLAAWSGEPGRPESFDALDALVTDQAWFLAHWRAGLSEIDYRRFFDIPELVAIRAERSDVFAAVHRVALRLSARGLVDGLRIDHVDGLHDPRAYLERLRERVGDRYIAVEKVLASDETLPSSWPVEGTTGYDFLRDVTGLLLEPDGAARLLAELRRRASMPATFTEIALGAKRDVLRMLFDGEVRALSDRLQRLARQDRHARDLTLGPLREALEAVTVGMDVYRTYVRGPEVAPADAERIERGLARAEPGLTDDARLALRFVRAVLLLEDVGRLPARIRDERVAFVMRWQQLTGPVAAKGVEDTALYRDVGLLAANDVGLEPDRPWRTPQEFHAATSRRARRHPLAMLATATHDTKRGEDARARLAVLSEMPERWLGVLAAVEDEARSSGADGADVREVWTLAQAAVAIWPPAGEAGDELVERLVSYLVKAMREAKVRTDWLAPDETHESAVERFARRTLRRGGTLRRALADVVPDVAWHGALNALAQLALKCTVPGVPDVYRGTELWDLSLVDPDNRRPFDLSARAEMLEALRRRASLAGAAALAGDLLRDWHDGLVKLWTLHRLLALRRRRAALFLGGDHAGCGVRGERAAHVVAMTRRRDDDAIVAVVPRHTLILARGRAPIGADVWGGTTLGLPFGARARWRDVLTDAEIDGAGAVPVADVLRRFPVAVLERVRRPGPEPG